MKRSRWILFYYWMVFVKCLYMFDSSFTSNSFTDLDGWTEVASQGGSKVSTCGSLLLAGGSNIFGKGTSLQKLFRLPPHYQIQFSVTFVKIDSWDDEYFYVYLDNTQIYSRKFTYTEGIQICAGIGARNELVVPISGTYSHNAPTALFLFAGILDEDRINESWGIRDFKLYIEPCPQQCAICSNSDPNQCSLWKISFFFWTALTPLETSTWSLVNAVEGSTTCGGIFMIGGLNMYGVGAKILNTLNISPHYKIRISFRFIKIDSWDNEKATLTVDGQEVWNSGSLSNFQGYPVNLCGRAEYEFSQPFTFDVTHTASTASLSFQTNLNEDALNESWGLRDFYLFILPCIQNCLQCTGPSQAECTQCQIDYIMLQGQCVPLNGYLVLETSFYDQGFTSSSGWILTNTKQGTTSQCGSNTLLGGYNVLGINAIATKTFTVPAHSKLRIMASLYLIDSWENEIIFMNVDGTKVFEARKTQTDGGTALCGGVGSNSNDLVVSVDVIVPHTATTVVIQISSTLNQAADDESWGFRNFVILYYKTSNCATFYANCNYGGTSYKLCPDQTKFPQDDIPLKIKSLKVPTQGKVSLFQQSDSVIGNTTFTTDQPCISSITYIFQAQCFQPFLVNQGLLSVGCYRWSL